MIDRMEEHDQPFQPGTLVKLMYLMKDPVVKYDGIFIPDDPIKDVSKRQRGMFELFGSSVGVYIGSDRIDMPSRRRGRKASLTARRVVDIFLFGGRRVALDPVFVEPISEA